MIIAPVKGGHWYQGDKQMYIDPKTYDLYPTKAKGLVEIDDSISQAIRNLNLKGYITASCCSGHNDLPEEYAYVMFGFAEPTPETLPEGWYWCDDGQQMEYRYKSGPGEARAAEIETVMDSLYEWSKALPDMRCLDCSSFAMFFNEASDSYTQGS